MDGGAFLLTIVRIGFSVFAFFIALYGLITGNDEFMPHMMFCLGAMFLVMGISELKESRKRNAIVCILTSGFVLFAFLIGFFS